jgi:hypothetical protein
MQLATLKAVKRTNRVLSLQLQAGPTSRAECNLAQISEKDLDRLGLGAFNFVDVISSPPSRQTTHPKSSMSTSAAIRGCLRALPIVRCTARRRSSQCNLMQLIGCCGTGID